MNECPRFKTCTTMGSLKDIIKLPQHGHNQDLKLRSQGNQTTYTQILMSTARTLLHLLLKQDKYTMDPSGQIHRSNQNIIFSKKYLSKTNHKTHILCIIYS